MGVTPNRFVEHKVIGQTLNNRYTITARLGKGAMGTVYSATDSQSGRDVALKVISSELVIDPDMLERFKREGEALSKLRHPNIVEFLDAFQHEEHYVIVMEYVSGGSLHELISKGPLPIDRANRIALELCDALIRSHHLNIIHRDIKPENVLVDEDGAPKLADFGVARLSEGTRMTRSGTQVGTPYYMSPEAWEGKLLDAQADIWSLGVILFEMLTGQVPFGGDTGAAVMNKVLTTQPPDMKKMRAEVSTSLAKIVSRMLTRDKKRRYQSIREVGVDLERAQQAGTRTPARDSRVGVFKSFLNHKFLLILGILIAGVILSVNTLTSTENLIPTNTLAARVTPQQTSVNLPAMETSVTEAPAPIIAPTSFECTDAMGCVDVFPGEPIHIAWIQSVSGAAAPLGQTNVNGGELAIDDKGSELLGHPILYDGEDSLCTREGGQAAGTKIAADPTVVAVLGTTCSSEARGAMPLIARVGMSMMSPSNTHVDLTDPNHPDHHTGYFRTSPNDIFQGRIAAEFAYHELGLRSAATVHDGSAYAQSLQKIFANVFIELGGNITAQEAINVGDTDFKPVLTRIAAGAPQIIYMPIFEPEGDLMASQKCDVPELENVKLIGADGLFSSTFPTTSGSCALGMYLSNVYVTGSAVEDFFAKYNAKFGENPPFPYAAHAYDAMNILFIAIEKVAVVDADGTVHIPRQALRDALSATKDFPGLTGTLSCNTNGDCGTGEILAIYEISQAMINGSQDIGSSTPVWQP